MNLSLDLPKAPPFLPLNYPKKIKFPNYLRFPESGGFAYFKKETQRRN
jgi:hypothetical protein